MRSERPSSYLVISPHLDDAVVSIGAWVTDMNRQGGKVEVATLFAGAPQGLLSEVAYAFHRNCGLPNDGSAMMIRRTEDAAAVSALGAGYRHGDFLDAVFRTRSDGSWLCQHERGMFDHTAPVEDGLFWELVDHVNRLCDATRPDTITTCVGIGGHLDHLLTRDAVLTVARRRGLRFWLWEDLPYALDTAEPQPNEPVTAQPYGPHIESWQKKWEAIASYPSQVRMLWGAADWRRLLCDHAKSRGDGQPAELLWEWRAGYD